MSWIEAQPKLHSNRETSQIGCLDGGNEVGLLVKLQSSQARAYERAAEGQIDEGVDGWKYINRAGKETLDLQPLLI